MRSDRSRARSSTRKRLRGGAFAGSVWCVTPTIRVQRRAFGDDEIGQTMEPLANHAPGPERCRMGRIDRKSHQSAQPQAAPVDDRSALRNLSGRLGSLVQRSGDLVAGVAGTVKDAARSPILKQALDARGRGNLAAAFHLVREDHALRPDDSVCAAAFWDIAVAYQRPAEAASAAAVLIKRHAMDGALELAAQYWVELHGAVADALLEPATFARLIPQLSAQVEEDRSHGSTEVRAHGRTAVRESEAATDSGESIAAALHRARADALIAALRGVVDERNHGLGAGLAYRVAELARDLDPPTALRAARFALGIEDLHEAKRERLLGLIAELDPGSIPRSADSLVAMEEVAPRLAVSSLDVTDTEIETAGIGEDDPARNHPARAVSPPPRPLSESDLASLQARLPPSRSPIAAAGVDADRKPAIGPASSAGVAPLAFDVPSDAPCGVATPSVELRAASESKLFPDLKVVTGGFSSLEADRIELGLADGRRVVIGLAQIEAIAVAEVRGLAESPVVVVDLLLNWREAGDGPLRAVRLRSDGLGPCGQETSVEDPGAALRGLLARLMERSRAIPLPDPDAALGLMIPAYASLAEYEREVLKVERRLPLGG